MAGMFVSYRPGDTDGQARALVLTLARLVGKDSIFMEVDNIALGRDFRRVLPVRSRPRGARAARICGGGISSAAGWAGDCLKHIHRLEHRHRTTNTQPEPRRADLRQRTK
jgi:hypothetical protein